MFSDDGVFGTYCIVVRFILQINKIILIHSYKLQEY